MNIEDPPGTLGTGIAPESFSWQSLGGSGSRLQQLQQLAEILGGHLQAPRLSWKYIWIQKLLGWDVAKRGQLSYNQYKSSAISTWDKAILLLQSTN